MNIRTISAGPDVKRMLQLAHHANQPVLLIGQRGVGKSALVQQAAKDLGIDFISCDLSMMEPTDLAGLPKIKSDGRTHFMPPAFLPFRGAGVLLLEELNRCPPYMRAPCLELCTRRRLNGYRLPQRWLPVAAINPPGGDYHVDELDPALLSRFLKFNVVADPIEWSRWAVAEGGIHQSIVDFVLLTPGIFDDADSNPRAWSYASNWLRVCERECDDKTKLKFLLDGIAGDVGETWASSFLEFYSKKRIPLTAAQILEKYRALRAIFKQWVAESLLDLVNASLESLKAHLKTEKHYEELLKESAEEQKANLRAFLSDLPPDLKRQMRGWLREHDFPKITVPH
jgi:hypothetical protein